LKNSMATKLIVLWWRTSGKIERLLLSIVFKRKVWMVSREQTCGYYLF
jgi:hypothetical protein